MVLMIEWMMRKKATIITATATMIMTMATTKKYFFTQENDTFRYLDYKEKWVQRFQQLVAYKEQHKNTKVPVNLEANLKLKHWVSQQPYLYNRGKLPSDQIDMLKSRNRRETI